MSTCLFAVGFRFSHNQRVIQGIGGGNRRCAPTASVGEQAVSEAVLAQVGARIGHSGATQQADAHDVVADVVAVLAVVEQTDAVVALAQVGPFLGAGFKARPVPTGVAVGGPLHVTPLNLISRHRGETFHREGYFQQDVPLAPVNGGVEIQAGTIETERDALGVIAVQDAAMDFQRGPQWAGLHHLHRRRRVARPHSVVEENVHVPGVKVLRTILERLELVGDGAGRQHLAPVGLVVDTGDVAVCVQLHPQVVIFQ